MIFRIFVVVSDQRKNAASIGTIRFIGYPENANVHPIKIAYRAHKTAWKLAYLGVKITPLVQKHKIVRKVAYLCVRKLRISFKDKNTIAYL